MKTFVTALFFLLAIFATPRLDAQAQLSKPAESRQATRCAVFYLLMSKVPAITADEKSRLETLVDGVGKIATDNGATKEEIANWAREFMNESASAAKQPKSTFNADQAKACEAFLSTRGAAAK